MYNKPRICTAFVLILLCLSGCFGGSTPIVVLHDVLEQAPLPVSVTEVETVGVYVDVTKSMKGFLAHPKESDEESLYSLCLNTMGRQIASSYKSVIFYRVDTPLWKVIGVEDVLEEARHTSYYEKSETFPKGRYSTDGLETEYKDNEYKGYECLCLTAALREGTKQDLFILITDLYENSIENNTNANAFISEIQQLANLNDDKVFGLIGVKSVFVGPVYDSGPNGKPTYHGSPNADTDSYRPFYIFLRGYPEHVREFCDSMAKRLEGLGAQRGKDYETSVFYEDYFWGLDYTAWKGSANRLSPTKNFIWQDDLTVTVSDTDYRADNMEISVYGYKKGSKDAPQGSLYFSYSVDSAHQAEFHALAEKIGKEQSVDFLPGGEKVLCLLPCPVQERTISYWNGEIFTPDDRKDTFEVCGLYYDQDAETLYAELNLEDQHLTEGLWRFEWKHMLEGSETALHAWLDDWQSPEKDIDYSKTERLRDYTKPMIEKLSNIEQCVLNGVAYLNIREG